MSKRRKVIKVNDLVIEADNVIVQPSRDQNRDPLFGGRRRDHDESEYTSHHEDESSNHDDESSSSSDGGGFSWI